MEAKTLLDKKLSSTFPRQKYSSIAHAFFGWLSPVLKLGSVKTSLEMEDLYGLDPENRSLYLKEYFLNEWKRQLVMHSKYPLYKVVGKIFGRSFFMAGVLKLVHDVLLFVSPIVIQGIILYLQDENAEKNKGLYYVGVIFVTGIVQSICLRHYFYYANLAGMRTRSAVIAAVYDKTLKLSSSARLKYQTGEITNLVTIDAQRLQDVTPYLHALWYGVVQICIAVYFLWQQLGVSCVAGIGVIVLIIPITSCIASVMKRIQKTLMGVKDRRSKITFDVLGGIKIIKFHAWEQLYTDTIQQVREEELGYLKKYVLTKTMSNTVFNTVSSMVAVASFMCYTLLGNHLQVDKALTSLALFNILRFPLFMFPQVVNNAVEASVSFKRIKQFLLQTEREVVAKGPLRDIGIQINNASFAWETTTIADGVALRDITLKLKQGDFCGVIGPVGSGKSTLLSSIIGENNCISGNRYLHGSVAYVSQVPFVQSATLKDNVLFGKPYNEVKFQQALRVSALLDDLKLFPNREMTEIGEKGITLSGGQRMRVSIARAVYQDADIYIFDDPFAALDMHVGKYIFESCLLTLLKHKLVVLVTNGLQYTSECNKVILVEDMKIKLREPLTEEERNKPKWQRLESEHKTLNAGELPEVTIPSQPLVVQSSLQEEKALGDVPLSVYYEWIKAAGGFRAALLITITYPVAQICNISSTVWLTRWSNSVEQESDLYFLYVYLAINFAYTVLVYLQTVAVYRCGLEASRTFFIKLFRAIVAAPMHFFDTTKLGRIINRLSSDIYMVDELIPSTWVAYLQCMVVTLATLITICAITPQFMVMLVPVCIGYWNSQQYFIKTSRGLQRLDAISRSPVYSVLGETIDGLSTIRAFQVQDAFIIHNNRNVDNNQRAVYLNFSVNCWLGLRLELAGNFIASGAALFAVLLHGTANSAYAGLAGVSLSYAFNVTQTMNWSVRMASQIETQMVAVERIHDYIQMETEDVLLKDRSSWDSSVAASWPISGQIEFKNVQLRYRPHLPLVLHNLSVTIPAGAKIGVVGRTGAGKSSLAVAIMRIVELSSGSIFIDDINIASMPLPILRSRLAIIPQDPILFSGTIRSNLDPFHHYADVDIWSTIRRAHLNAVLSTLDDEVQDGGKNFSLGERQLLCIARSMLRKCQIFLLDEATASIDTATDALVQRTFRSELKHKTCIIIAHRIQTIMKSDKILVLDKGKLAEYDTPSHLLFNPNGLFTALVKSLV